MATTGQAETPTNNLNSKVNNCDNAKLVNGSAGEPDYNSPENNNAMKEGYRGYNHHNYDHHRNSHHPQPPPQQHPSEKGGMEGPAEYPQQPPPHQQYQQYPPYSRGYGEQPPPHHNGPESYQQHYPPPPMRFPGKPMPGGGPNAGPQPHGYPPGGGGMRPSYPGPGGMGGGPPGQSISQQGQQPSGQTPTLNQLLQSGGANAGASGGGSGHRFPPPAGYEHPFPPNHPKADYSQGPTGWPPANRPPSSNSYAHPPPPQFQQQQQMYRQNAPGGGNSRGPPQPGSGQPQPYYQQGPPHHYPPPPNQSSSHYPPPPHQQRYPSPGPGMRPPADNQPPSHYPPVMPPPDMGSSEPPKSTPPPPQSPSLANHGQNPPSPQQSPRSTPHPPPVSSASNLPPPSSPSHRPQGSSPSNSYPPPDAGEGCNSNDGQNQVGPGPRPSPSPTGSASSRSMSPAVGNQNIPMPPRPSSSQSDGTNQRMSQSPMPPGQGYPGGQPMAPPPHHMYQSGGKHGAMVPPPGGGPPPPQQQSSHYPPHQQPPNPSQHWPPHHHQQQQPPPPQGQQQQYRPPPQQHGQHGGMMNPYPPPPQQQPPMQPNNYGSPRHPAPNGPPNQYYPPQYQNQAPPPQGWTGGPNNPPSGTPPPPPRSQLHHAKQQLQHKLGYGGYPMGPPGSGMPPSQTPPPPHHGGPPLDDSGNNPPNLVSVGPDGATDEVSQQSTLSNASGTSGGDDGPAMPKLRPEGARPHPNYPSHPPTPQNNAAPSPGAASMNSAHEDYGDMNSPGSGWPRTPASPLNSHPPPPSEHFRGKNKKADSLNKLYDMDEDPGRKMFLDKLIHFMDENSTPIASCPTISKNPLDLFKLYLLVKDRGGFLEVSKNKTWKDIAGSLGIGASSSAAYTLRKHYTKHLFAFECKFDRGGIDPQPLINQVETSSKKKGKSTAPVPSPGSSNSQDSFPGPNNNTNSSSMDGFNSSTSSNYPSYGQQPPPGEYGQSPGPAPSPLARPLPPQGPPNQPNAQQQQQPPHPGDKSQINVSNPFDDQYPQLYQQQSRPNYYPPYSSQLPSGYQGPPPNNYPPYQGQEQYPGRPPMPPHEGYPGQGYPGRSMYPPYGETPSSGPAPSSQGPYPGQPPSSAQQSLPPPPPQGPPQHQPLPPTSQNSNSGTDDRYNMGPPSSAGGPGGPPPQPQPGGYPPRGSPYPNAGGTQQGPPPGSSPTPQPSSHPTPPPNGYPSQDYYNSQSQTEQGYPPGGKHMPPPHSRYPPGGKDGPQSQYPGYPSPSQGSPQRVPPYDGQASRVGFSGPPRSTPSPSPAAPPPAPPQKPWNAPEGWPPGPGGHYPGPQQQQQQQQRGYPPQGSAPSPHTPPQGATPAPAQSPGVTPPQQAISPQPWSGGRPGPGPPPPTGSSQPPQPPPGANWPPQQDQRYGPSSGGMMPSTPPSAAGPHNQPPWTPPGPGSQLNSRSGGPPGGGGRLPFPGGKPTPGDMFRGYGPSPSSLQPLTSSSKGPMPPSIGHPHGPPQPGVGYLPPMPMQQPSTSGPHIINKKDMVFPPESVEAVTPVLSRRRKLHKSDVAPVEAWRIMMCLKSGLLAETTWALDVLNVLLYDDHTVSYFSLTYLPGLLDILLEHLRRALILLFGQSVGLDLTSDKFDDVDEANKLQWYEREEKVAEEIPDIGIPSKNFPRDCHKTIVLQGSTNYTMISRINGRKVRIVSRDDEPFICPGTRDWDLDEKSRSDPDIEQLHGGAMESKHIVTYFATQLPIPLSIVRDMKAEERRQQKLINNSEPLPPQIKLPEGNLYRCETKLPTIVKSEPSSITVTVTNTPSNSNPPTPMTPASATVNNSSSSTNNNNTSNNKKLENGPLSLEKEKDKLVIPEKKNCIFPTPTNSLQNSKINNSVIQKKAKRLDDVLGRIRKDQSEDDNALSEPPTPIINSIETSSSPVAFIKQETNSESSIPQAPTTVLENGLSDSGLLGGGSDNSNMSAAVSENTCDSSSKHQQQAQNKNVEVQIGDLSVRDPGATLKRKRMEDYEDECYTRDESSLYLVTESQDSLARRCLSICNIIRNLTFVPGNEMEFGRCIPFLSLVGKLILLHHDHPLKKKPKETPQPAQSLETKTIIKEEPIEIDEKEKAEQQEEEKTIESMDVESSSNSKEEDTSKDSEMKIKEKKEDGEDAEEEEESLFAAEETASDIVAVVDIDADSCTSLTNGDEWWWDYVHHIREHVLVMIANISGQMDLSQFSEEISRPILDGLLHWAICPAAYGQDPFPTLNQGAYLSPQRLAIEALVKLSVIQGNVDLLLATPPYSRIEKLCQLLCRSLCRTEEQVMREFALNLLYYLSAADSGVARTIALQNPCISLLISFIEQAEHNAMSIANNHGFSVLRENPEAMGTSLDMLRRAAMTLLNLARHPDNRPLFVQHEPRLLQLVMSQILEQKVAAMVAQVLYQCSTPDAPSTHKYLYASNMDTFYTPLFSRSRQPHHSQIPHHHMG